MSTAFFRPFGYNTLVTLIAADNDSGRRLDRVLRKALPEIPLSALYRLFRTRMILVNGTPASGADRVQAGNVIQISENGALLHSKQPKRTPNRMPERLSLPGREAPGPDPASKRNSVLEILFEGLGLLVLNKQPGLALHGPDEDNLNRRVQSYLEGKIPASLSFRPGPLHRLDKPTSGVVVFSTCLEGARTFSKLLEEGKLVKTYLAILEGNLEKEALWNDSLFRNKKIRKSMVRRGTGRANGAGNSHAKEAVTRVRPLCRSKSGELILALVEPETGRTHQIRAQAALHHVPLRGDRKYGSKEKGGFFLHALSLEFPPNTPFPRRIRAPLPDAFSVFLREHFGLLRGTEPNDDLVARHVR
jgi:23S rRNA pseudouridine955/2504/2580 synthase